MLRNSGLFLGLGAAALGCSLLTPYPGGGDPADALSQGPTSGSPIEGGSSQEPLFDPAVDDSVSVVSNIDQALALPGSAFPIDLGFVSPGANVIGGGIQFPGSDKVQWTFIEGLEGQRSGNINFGYVVAKEVCDDIPNLCHKILTTQFAVARNPPGTDVDGDGVDDGQFVVSEGVTVPVVLQCATCESKSCQSLLPVGTCFYCAQPQVCRDYFDRCLAEGQPNFGTDEADLFASLFGANGILWGTQQGCSIGETACTDAQTNAETAPDECGL